MLYVDRKSPDANAILQSISNDKELRTLCEDSGEWMFSSRVPLSSGISFVEGEQKSWDLGTLPAVRQYLNLLASGMWSEPDGNPIPIDHPKVSPVEKRNIEAVLKARSLEPIGRVTQIPGLRSD